MTKATPLYLCCALMPLGGCAFDVIHVAQTPASLDTSQPCNDSFELTQDIDVEPSGGYKRTLKKETRWHCVGKLQQGDVYKTRDQVLTVEASHIYEADIVVSAHRLVGFYLPVERSFSPLPSPLELVSRTTTPE